MPNGKRGRGRPVGTTKTHAERREARLRRIRERHQTNRQVNFLHQYFGPARNHLNDNAVEDNLQERDIDHSYDFDDDNFDDSDDESTDEPDEDNFQEVDIEEEANSIVDRYLRAIRQQIQKETSAINNQLVDRWLTTMLQTNDYWIRTYHAKKICSNLSIEFSEEGYYRDVFVWLPDIHWGLFQCPNTHCKKTVCTHGWPDHVARRVQSLTGHYFVMARRYICKECKEKRDKRQDDPYTWIGSSEAILTTLPYNAGSYFPAFLTHKSGLDNTVVDLMRSLFILGIRPKQMAALIDELSRKTHSRK